MPIRVGPTVSRHYRTQPPDCGCAPKVCPECGGLECLCRPRFFAGQLLSEEDLNRLDHYLVEKNKLHNRHLFGWGVVCGLEVVCHPCRDQVIVRPGYALSPCGDDIVVCRETVVPICELINDCRDRRPLECEPYPAGGGDDCADREQEWIISIRYDEKPSRGVVPLRDERDTGSTCGCGNVYGGASCACGHHTNGPPTGRNGAGKTRTPPQCEPTVTCEGFTFEVSKATPKPVAPRNPEWRPSSERAVVGVAGIPGASKDDAVKRCLAELVAIVPPRPSGRIVTAAQLHDWCCALKEALREFFQTHSTYDCQLDERLARAVCPRPPAGAQGAASDEYVAAVNDAANELREVARAYLEYCACSALLPPCPPPVFDPRVPLATVIVRGDACTLVRVCNLGVRRYVPTFPLLERFLGQLGLGGQVGDRLVGLCCRPPAPKEDPVRPPVRPVRPLDVAGFRPRPAPFTLRPRQIEDDPSSFGRLTLEALARPERRLDTGRLLLGALGGFDAEGRPLATDVELEHPMQALLVGSLVGPLLNSLIPPEAAGAVRPLAANIVAAIARSEESREAAVGRLRDELEALRKTLADQQATITRLQADLGRQPRRGGGR